MLNSTTLRRIRPWAQVAAFVLFLGLLLRARSFPIVPADLFFRLDPLAGLAGMLAARTLVPGPLIGGVIGLGLAVLLGRAWCGWLCPLGTVLDWTPARRARPHDADLAPRWRQAKYFLLVLVLAAALLGNLALVFLDPITLIYRTGAVVVWPALNVLLSGAERVAYLVPLLRGPVDLFEENLRGGAVFPAFQPLYGAGVVAALFFAGILALNAIRPRFWCRYLCPLGALLGVVSKIALVRRTLGGQCVECGRCARACPTGTIDPSHGFQSDPSECIMCLECVPTCSRHDQHFVFQAPLSKTGDQTRALRHAYDPSRRQFIASAGTAVAVAGLLGAEPAAGRASAYLIRPPGAAQNDLPSRCIRCGICVKVCPTSGLQPSLAAAGWGGLWTPVLVPRLGQCDFACNSCGQACPTGAIPPLALEEKQAAVIGHAYVDQSRCLPWASGRNCIVCEEMCPLPEKAIQLEEVDAWTPDGTTVTVQRPHVLLERCIGCGICENRCPLNGEAAIRIYAPTDMGATG